MPEIFANNVAGALASGITSTQTSIPLEPGHTFPDPGPNWYRATLYRIEYTAQGINELDHEVVMVTALSGDTLTVTREQEDTTPKAFEAGTAIELRLTAGALSATTDRSNHTGTQEMSTISGLSEALDGASTKHLEEFSAVSGDERLIQNSKGTGITMFQVLKEGPMLEVSPGTLTVSADTAVTSKWSITPSSDIHFIRDTQKGNLATFSLASVEFDPGWIGKVVSIQGEHFIFTSQSTLWSPVDIGQASGTAAPGTWTISDLREDGSVPDNALYYPEPINKVVTSEIETVEDRAKDVLLILSSGNRVVDIEGTTYLVNSGGTIIEDLSAQISTVLTAYYRYSHWVEVAYGQFGMVCLQGDYPPHNISTFLFRKNGALQHSELSRYHTTYQTGANIVCVAGSTTSFNIFVVDRSFNGNYTYTYGSVMSLSGSALNSRKRIGNRYSYYSNFDACFSPTDNRFYYVCDRRTNAGEPDPNGLEIGFFQGKNLTSVQDLGMGFDLYMPGLYLDESKGHLYVAAMRWRSKNVLARACYSLGDMSKVTSYSDVTFPENIRMKPEISSYGVVISISGGDSSDVFLVPINGYGYKSLFSDFTGYSSDKYGGYPFSFTKGIDGDFSIIYKYSTTPHPYNYKNDVLELGQNFRVAIGNDGKYNALLMTNIAYTPYWFELESGRLSGIYMDSTSFAFSSTLDEYFTAKSGSLRTIVKKDDNVWMINVSESAVPEWQMAIQQNVYGALEESVTIPENRMLSGEVDWNVVSLSDHLSLAVLLKAYDPTKTAKFNVISVDYNSYSGFYAADSGGSEPDYEAAIIGKGNESQIYFKALKEGNFKVGVV